MARPNKLTPLQEISFFHDLKELLERYGISYTTAIRIFLKNKKNSK